MMCVVSEKREIVCFIVRGGKKLGGPSTKKKTKTVFIILMASLL